jgi:Bacterial SH3 domain
MRISLARSLSNRQSGVRRLLARTSRLTHGDRTGRLQGIECPVPKGLAQLKNGPASSILPPINPSLRAEANCYVTRVGVDTKNHLHIGAESTEEWLLQRFVDQRLLDPFPVFLSGIRMLVAGLVVVALLPNAILGAIFWLGVINTPWSTPATSFDETSASAAKLTIPPPTPVPVLSAPAALEATAGAQINFPITLDGTDGVPARSIISVKGLPQGSKLSSGRAYDETEWNLKPDEIGDLHLVVPHTASGEAKLSIQLVATDGAVIADTRTALRMTTHSTANVGASKINSELAESRVMDEPAEMRGITGAEVRLANLEAEMAVPKDPVPLPTRPPAQTANDDANWITLTSVNIRERPTRSAPAIAVVGKGTKLHLIERKRGWVRVTNLATSEKGWIYARHVATAR